MDFLVLSYDYSMTFRAMLVIQNEFYFPLLNLTFNTCDYHNNLSAERTDVVLLLSSFIHNATAQMGPWLLVSRPQTQR